MDKFMNVLCGIGALGVVTLCVLAVVNDANVKEEKGIVFEDDTERFQSIDEFDGVCVIVDTETGVQYLWRGAGYKGGLTVLLDAEGKPLLYEFKTGVNDDSGV